MEPQPGAYAITLLLACIKTLSSPSHRERRIVLGTLTASQPYPVSACVTWIMGPHCIRNDTTTNRVRWVSACMLSAPSCPKFNSCIGRSLSMLKEQSCAPARILSGLVLALSSLLVSFWDSMIAIAWALRYRTLLRISPGCARKTHGFRIPAYRLNALSRILNPSYDHVARTGWLGSSPTGKMPSLDNL